MSNRLNPKSKESEERSIMKKRVIARLLLTFPVLYGATSQLALADGDLEAVVVTAQKRTQSLQEVPISVTAFSGKVLADFGMQNFDDIAVPGVHIGTGARNESLYVRGVGSGTNFGFEQSVPVYIDGTYYGRARAENLGFLDVERIEVLKGPQPTFFGQNAIAGAVSITTARPSKELFGYVDVAYEANSREKAISGAISGPISDALRARLAFKNLDSEGWMTNAAVNNTRVPQKKDTSVRLSAELDVSKDFKAYFKYETSDEKQYGRNRQIINCGLVTTATAPPTTIGNFIDRTASSPEDCEFNNTQASISVQAAHPEIPLEGTWGYIQKTKYNGGLVALDWDVGGYKVSSITSSYEMDFRIPQNDVDGSSKEITNIATTDINKQVSQELRILSPQGQPLQWIAGVYFDRADLKTSGTGDLYIMGDALPVAPVVIQTASQTSNSWSLFGEAAYKLSDKLTGKLGGRYSEVKKSTVVALDSQQLAFGTLIPTPFRPGPPNNLGPALFPNFTYIDSRTDGSFQPAFTLEYRPQKDVMSYATVKRGFKAGGYDQDTLTVPGSKGGVGGSLAFAPETVTAYEAGIKSRLMDGKATLNVSAFRSDYDDLQVSVFSGTLGFNTTNAARSRSQGLEVDAALAVNNQLTLKAGLTYLDAKYLSFTGASCNAIQTVAAAGAPCTQDLSDKPLQFAPTWSGNLSATQKFSIGSAYRGSAQMAVFLTSDYRTSGGEDANTIQSGFAKIDARFAVAPNDGNWEVALLVRNLTNKVTSHWIERGVSGPLAPSIFYQAFQDRPRQIELQAKMSF